MKKVFAYLSLVVFLLVGCSIDEESTIEEIGIENRNKIFEKRGSRNETINIEYLYVKMTIKYKNDVTKKQKENIRGARYLFETRKIVSTTCRDVEYWHIRYNDEQGGGQNGTADDQYLTDKKEWLYKDTALEKYTDRIEFDWIGECNQF